MPSPEPLPGPGTPAGPAPDPAEPETGGGPAPSALRFVRPAQLALLVAVALWALLFHARLPSRLPSEDDYRAAAAILDEEAAPKDAVLLFPWWAERARRFVPERLPVVGYLRSKADPLWRHPRIWVLAQPELPRADLDGFLEAFLPGRTRVGEPRRLGTLELTLYENGRYRPHLFAASEALLLGRAYVQYPDGRRVDCPRQGDAFRCPTARHLYARTEWHEVFYEPRRCVYLHPPGGEAKLVVELPKVPLSGEGLLEAGYIWEHAVKKGGGFTSTAVTLEDAATGETLARLDLAPGTEGFQKASVLARRPSPSALRLSIQSRNPKDRLVCVDLTVFAPRKDGA